MSNRGPALVIAAVALGAAAAGAGAAANLHLLEPHRTSASAIVLGTHIESTSTTTVPGEPVTTSTEPADDPTIGPAAGGSTSTTAPGTASPTTSTTAASALRHTYAVGAAGSVTVVLQGGALTLDSVAPGARWTGAVEKQGTDEIEVRFRRDSGEQASFKATVDDGAIRVEVDADEVESPDD